MKTISVTIASALICSATAAFSQDVGEAGRGRGLSAQADEAQPLSLVDAEFAARAHSFHVAETALGQFAEARAGHQTVRELAGVLASYHALARAQLEQLLSKNGIPIPSEDPPTLSVVYEKLERESGGEFDREFMQHLIRGYDDATREFQHEAERGQNQELRTYAEQQLPVLRAHLRAARRERWELSQPTSDH